MSRREYKTINRRLQAGRTTSANEGKYPGSKAPFGYKRIKLQNQKGFSLEVVPEQAKIVRLIYDMYCKGHTPCEIASTLDKMHISPVNGGSNGHWSEHSLRDILSNPIYLGKIRWKDRKVVKKVKNGHLVSSQPKNKDLNDVILVDGLHDAIITQEQFKKAEQIRKNNCFSPIPSCYNIKNPLSGIVYCSKCGRNMRRVLSKGIEILACTNSNCNNISSNLDIVENKLFSTISSLLYTYEKEYESIELPQNNNENIIKIKQDELDNIKTEIDQTETQLDNIQTLLEKGVYDLDTYSNRSKKVCDLLNNLKTEYSNTNNSISELINKTSSKNDLMPKLKPFLNEYHKLSIEDKNKLLKTVLVRVEYLKEVKCYGKHINKDNFELKIFPKF